MPEYLIQSIGNYYGIDWLANIAFALYAWIVVTAPDKAQWYAVAGAILNVVLAVMIVSMANALFSIAFFFLYLRAAVKLKQKSETQITTNSE